MLGDVTQKFVHFFHVFSIFLGNRTSSLNLRMNSNFEQTDVELTICEEKQNGKGEKMQLFCVAVRGVAREVLGHSPSLTYEDLLIFETGH